MPTWNGLTGLNAAPTAAAPRLIATATTGRNPSRRASSSTTGTRAMISSFMLSSTPPRANASETTGMTTVSAFPTRRTSQSTPCRTAARGGGGTSRRGTRGQATDFVKLVHVHPARRLAGDAHHRARDGLCPDRAVLAQSPDQHPCNQRAHEPRQLLHRPTGGALADQERRPKNVDAVELQALHALLDFALHAEIGRAHV